MDLWIESCTMGTGCFISFEFSFEEPAKSLHTSIQNQLKAKSLLMLKCGWQIHSFRFSSLILNCFISFLLVWYYFLFFFFLFHYLIRNEEIKVGNVMRFVCFLLLLLFNNIKWNTSTFTRLVWIWQQSSRKNDIE